MPALSHIEQYLLCIYTLFEVEGSQQERVRGTVASLTGQPLVDFKATLAALKSKGYFEERGYNWRNDTYDYRVTAEKLIPLMLYFYEQQPNLTIQVLEAVRGMKPSGVQRMLWNYISSDFEKINIEEISDYQIGESLEMFVPAVTDSRFIPLLMVFSQKNFHDLVEKTILDAMSEEAVLDVAYLRTLIYGYRFDILDSIYSKGNLRCLCDLIEYLCDGSLCEQINTENKYHCILAAIRCAYAGEMKKSMEMFKKAVTLNNKSNGFYTSTKSYLPIAIANFYYVLVAYRSDTEEGHKKALAIAKSSETSVTMSAKLLYSILYGSGTEKQLRDGLNRLYAGGKGMDRVLAMLMCRYVGKDFSSNVVPQWNVVRHEMSRFMEGIRIPASVTGNPYGDEPLLATVYHRQQWESVLSDLTGLNADIDIQPLQKKDVRIGYFMQSTKSTHAVPRQQTTLKNGGWGAGRQVSMSNFLSDTIEGTTEADRRIIDREQTSSRPSLGVRLLSILPEMTGESRLYVGRYAPFSLVEVTEEMPYITLHHDNDGFLITSNVTASEVESDIIITYRGATSINFIRLTNKQRPYYRRLLSIERFPNEAEPQLRRFLEGIGGRIEIHSDLIEGGSTLPICDGTPKLVMQMRPDRNARSGESYYTVSFFVRPLQGGRIRCTPGVGNEVITDSAQQTDAEGKSSYMRTRVKRDLDTERENVSRLTESIREEVPEMPKIIAEQGGTVSASGLLPLIEYAQNNPDRMACEWPEGSQMRIKQRRGTAKWNGAITRSDNGWFEIEGSVELDQDKVISMSQLLELARQSRGRFVTLGNGDFLALSDKLRRQLDQLGTLVSRHHGRLQMSPFTAALLEPDMMDGELQLTEDSELTAIRQRIKESGSYTPEVPTTLHATLREYQREGYQWMSRLNYWGAGALLADDMGLGKTIQTITFLLAKAEEGPALVIAPASVAPNWKVEFSKFAPSLRVSLLNFEQDRTETIRTAGSGDVVVCTYMLLLSVREAITKKEWNTICLDEAHIIKNRGAKTSAVAMKLKSRNRIMLTGTPVQNHLGELWNLFQFVNPGLLGSFEDFNRRFIIPIEQNRDATVQHQLDRLVKPFMLRRTKDKVAQELPDKEEIYQHVTMSEEEQLAYEAMRQRAEAMLVAGISASSSRGGVTANTLAEITRLRLAACCQSKTTAMLELLQTVLDGYDRLPPESRGGALVFSQFTTYLAEIQKALQAADIPYLYIDGTVPIKSRQQLVERFQAGECPVFLISLKAGGLGLNLTRANYVIHMDPWWNPAIEAQATDRSHRIGQRRSVTVYHLISQGTIEEKIQRLHERKQTLVSNILAATDMSHRLTGEELLEMVRL